MMWLDDQEDEGNDAPRDTARAVLRQNVVERFRTALGVLKELASSIDPALVERQPGGATMIAAEVERWLRRQLAGLE